MPAEQTEFTPLFQTFLYFSAGVALLVYVWMVYALVRYRQRNHRTLPSDAPRAGYFPPERDHKTLEIAWTVGPTLLVIYLTYISLGPLANLWNLDGYDAAEDDVQYVEVQGSQWIWKFTYPNGTTGFNELRLSRDRPVQLNLTSTDVLHSFFISELGLKEDAVPGITTTLAFDPKNLEPGQYPVACAEYCGLDHSQMRATLVIV